MKSTYTKHEFFCQVLKNQNLIVFLNKYPLLFFSFSLWLAIQTLCGIIIFYFCEMPDKYPKIDKQIHNILRTLRSIEFKGFQTSIFKLPYSHPPLPNI